MADDVFRMILERVEKDERERTTLMTREMKEVFEQNNEIGELIEAIEDAVPDDEPFLYTGS